MDKKKNQQPKQQTKPLGDRGAVASPDGRGSIGSSFKMPGKAISGYTVLAASSEVNKTQFRCYLAGEVNKLSYYWRRNRIVHILDENTQSNGEHNQTQRYLLSNSY